jgi:hypothetical protein
MYSKILSIHTEDRDVTKYPSSSNFAVDLPIEYKNVYSMKLIDIELPSNYYVFSESNQNTKMTVTVGSVSAIITITEGTYSPTQLASELTGQLNAAFGSIFQVYFNTTTMKFVFSCSSSFTLVFSEAEIYSGNSFYEQYTQWGLGSYLGFSKKDYESIPVLLYPMYADGIVLNNANILEPPFTESVFGDSHIYMEIDQYNSMDEIQPYTQYSSNMFSGKYDSKQQTSKHGGKHNSSFAKIPTLSNEKMYISKESFLLNIFYSEPPLERIQKLKFKFRYHDGRPIDFGSVNFSFTIEFKLAKDYIKHK